MHILQSVPRCVPKSFFWSKFFLVETRACWPRDACYPGCARHLTPLYVPVSPWATCKPCPMVLVLGSTVHCSRPPARNLHLSSSDHALGPWAGFMYIYYHAMLLTWCDFYRLIPGTYVYGGTWYVPVPHTRTKISRTRRLFLVAHTHTDFFGGM